MKASFAHTCKLYFSLLNLHTCFSVQMKTIAMPLQAWVSSPILSYVHIMYSSIDQAEIVHFCKNVSFL